MAVVALVAEYAKPLNSLIFDNLPDDIRAKFSNLPFAVSCLILAGIVSAFTTLSTRASDEGGLIASSYPEIRDLQTRMGILQDTAARIENKADRLLDATHQWISITDFRVWDNPDGQKVHIRLENNTPLLFKNARGSIRTSDTSVVEFGSFALGADAIHWDNFPTNSAPEGMSVCLIAERTKDGMALREIRTYSRGKNDGVSWDYLLEEVDGPSAFEADVECET